MKFMGANELREKIFKLFWKQRPFKITVISVST